MSAILLNRKHEQNQSHCIQATSGSLGKTTTRPKLLHDMREMLLKSRILFRKLRTRHDLVDENTLIELGKDFRRKLLTLADPLLVRVHLAWHCYKNRSYQGVPRALNIIQLIGGHVQPARLFVTDLGRAFTFDLRRGLQPSDLTQSSSDISLPSASLAYCLKFPWGGDTLYVNGCFQENDDWKNVGSMIYPNRFFKYCNLVRSVELGKKLTWSTAAKALVRKLGFRKVGMTHALSK